MNPIQSPLKYLLLFFSCISPPRLFTDASHLTPSMSPNLLHSPRCNTPNAYTPGSYKKKPCNCKQSKCLKLYCECFASGGYCDPSTCNCINCCNNIVFLCNFRNMNHKERLLLVESWKKIHMLFVRNLLKVHLHQKNKLIKVVIVKGVIV